MKIFSRLAPLAVLALPLIAFAQVPTPNLSAIKRYSTDIVGFINGVLVPVLIALAFIVFLWGVYKYYILGADNEAERAKGHQFVLWGIIGFVVIFSLWGLVAIVGGVFGFSPTSPTAAPPPPRI